MKLEIKINQYYLVWHAMTSKKIPFSSWKNLKERIWKKYKLEPVYYFFSLKYNSFALERIHLDLSKNSFNPKFLLWLKKIKKIYNEIFETKEFKKLLTETKLYLKFVNSQWQKNKTFALLELTKLSGLPLPKEKITVYLTHPNLSNGKVIDKNNIVFGHKEDFKNYFTIYLCHELLHIMIGLDKTFEPDYPLTHALICLVANNELRIRLNKKGKYFKENGYLTETKDIIKIEKTILKYFKKYLKGEMGKNILELKEKIKREKKNLLPYP